MVTQLHLALVLAMDVQLLILDEPTLGLDIVYRSQFYQQILNEFLSEDRTLLISTHQVEEIESLLTHLIFIDQGKIRLDAALDDVYSRYRAVDVVKSQMSAARGLKPLSEQAQIEGACMIFDGVSAESLAELGTTRRVGSRSSGRWGSRYWCWWLKSHFCLKRGSLTGSMPMQRRYRLQALGTP
jgi:ABC-2 type transport system ATP-binding protein